MNNLWVELHAVEFSFIIGDHGKGAILGRAHHLETGRQFGDPVAVAHPNLVALAGLPGAVHQGAIAIHLDKSAAKFLMLRWLHRAAKLGAHGLLAIADAQHGNTHFEQRLRRPWRIHLGHRGWPAREDNAVGPALGKGLRGLGIGHDFAIDIAFAQTPGNQLGDLAAEI